MVDASDNFEEYLTGLLLKFTEEHRLEKDANISVTRGDDGSDFRIEPVGEDYAAIHIYYQNGDPIIYLTIADNNTMEFLVKNGRDLDESAIKEFESIISGIVFNGIRETVWKSGEKIVGSRIEVVPYEQTEPVSITTSSIHNPFIRTRTEVRKYLPYLRKKVNEC